MPLRFIQPARCVVTATSADTVTIASPTGSRPSAPSTRPNASCVEARAGTGASSVSGTSGGGGQRRQAGDVAPLRTVRREARPLLAGRHAEPGAQLLDLGGGGDHGVIQ